MATTSSNLFYHSCFTENEPALEGTEACIINGVGVAGQTLACWLRKAGHEVLLVEAAPQSEKRGQASIPRKRQESRPVLFCLSRGAFASSACQSRASLWSLPAIKQSPVPENSREREQAP